MSTCPSGHPVSESLAFCHECGAPLPPPPTPTHSDVHLYVSIASVVAIVLGIFGIVWVLNEGGSSRQALASEAGLSRCGQAPQRRPTSIALTCGGAGGSLTDVTWTQWNARSATGTGVYSSGGKETAATIGLSGVTRTSSGYQFTLVTVTPSGAAAFSQPITPYAPGSSTVTASARVPLSGSLCAGPSAAGASKFGVVGTHTSCDFADQVRLAYLESGGYGQALKVTATSKVTHRTYRNIACSAGTYVVCVGGADGTAKVFFGPFN